MTWNKYWRNPSQESKQLWCHKHCSLSLCSLCDISCHGLSMYEWWFWWRESTDIDFCFHHNHTKLRCEFWSVLKLLTLDAEYLLIWNSLNMRKFILGFGWDLRIFCKYRISVKCGHNRDFTVIWKTVFFYGPHIYCHVSKHARRMSCKYSLFQHLCMCWLCIWADKYIVYQVTFVNIHWECKICHIFPNSSYILRMTQIVLQQSAACSSALMHAQKLLLLTKGGCIYYYGQKEVHCCAQVYIFDTFVWILYPLHTWTYFLLYKIMFCINVLHFYVSP